MTSTLIRDNAEGRRVADFLKENITPGSDVSIVSAFFTIYAYSALKDNLNSIECLRFLFGEPNFVNMSEGKSPKDFAITDSALEIRSADAIKQKQAAKECAEWIENKVEIRSLVKPNFLHGKLYSITQSNGTKKAISGSSNFTTKGLGLAKSNNMELNLIVDSDREKDELLSWFDALWLDTTGLVEDVKSQVLSYLRQVYKENSPEFIYFKTLYSILGGSTLLSDDKFFEDDKRFLESKIWKVLYDFQKAGVKGAIDKIKRYNGCIIADSVGLGKTYEALAVIKYFEMREKWNVLVVCPKKLSDNWTLYQKSQNNMLNPLKDDNFGYDLLYHTDMGRTKGSSGGGIKDLSTFGWDAYDLVVIDESHNFRGDPIERNTIDGKHKINRAAWLMNRVIKSGRHTRVLLLSATPVNTALRDLRNQINLITQGENDALEASHGVTDIAAALQTAQRQFSLWADPSKVKGANKENDLMAHLDTPFFAVMDALTIARSRRQITSAYDTSAIGSFPRREKPLNLYYKPIDREDEFPAYSKVDKDISGYKLSLFNPTKYVLPGRMKKYETGDNGHLTQAFREESLIGMMKMNYMKRLESSVHSFSLSLSNTLDKIKSLEDKIHKYQATNKDEGVEAEEADEETEEANSDLAGENDFMVGSKLKFQLSDIDCGRWLVDLKGDKDALLPLQKMAEAVTAARDNKLDTLKKTLLKRKEKTLIFTAFADTALYLYDNIKDWAKTCLGMETAAVTGTDAASTTGCNTFERVLLNFAPIAKNRAGLGGDMKEKDIDILIATDCISEGQNLQDCAFLVNYDIHWNPVRIIQRFGRIDRIGSKKDAIQMANFWPTDDLDGYLNLKNRVVTRMALVNVAATGGDNVLTPEQEGEEKKEKTYRDRQLEKLKENALDIEELDDTVTLTDFTLDAFRADLGAFLKENERQLRDSPDGIYAVVPSSKELPEGVIFCLRKKEEEGLPSKDKDKARGKINPFAPYFLVYILHDGTVKYAYMNARKTLAAFRALCNGKKEPIQDLCEAFNRETQDGKDMARYYGLLKKAVSQSNADTKQRAASLLTSSRSGVLLGRKKAADEDAAADEYALVTWLVVR